MAEDEATDEHVFRASVLDAVGDDARLSLLLLDRQLADALAEPFPSKSLWAVASSLTSTAFKLPVLSKEAVAAISAEMAPGDRSRRTLSPHCAESDKLSCAVAVAASAFLARCVLPPLTRTLLHSSATCQSEDAASDAGLCDEHRAYYQRYRAGCGAASTARVTR